MKKLKVEVKMKEIAASEAIVNGIYVRAGALYKVLEISKERIVLQRVNSRARFDKKLEYVKTLQLPSKEFLIQQKKIYLKRINRINLALADVAIGLQPYEAELVVEDIRLEIKKQKKK